MAWAEPTAALTPKLLAECQRRWRQRESASASGGICVIQKAEIDTFGLTELRPGVSSVPVTALATAGTSCLNCLIRGQVQAGKKLCSNVVLLRQTELGEAEVIEIQNKEAEIAFTNYWQIEHAARGLRYLSGNAGTWRLLVPSATESYLSEIRTGRSFTIESLHQKQGVLGLGIRGWTESPSSWR